MPPVVTVVPGVNAQLRFTTQAGLSYTIRARERLDTGSWVKVLDVAAGAAGRVGGGAGDLPSGRGVRGDKGMQLRFCGRRHRPLRPRRLRPLLAPHAGRSHDFTHHSQRRNQACMASGLRPRGHRPETAGASAPVVRNGCELADRRRLHLSPRLPGGRQGWRRGLLRQPHWLWRGLRRRLGERRRRRWRR